MSQRMPYTLMIAVDIFKTVDVVKAVAVSVKDGP